MPENKRRANAFLMVMISAIFVLFVVMILLMTQPARADELPAGVSCEQVRSLVAEHGKVKAIAWAIEHGLSIRQIYLIRKTCKV